MHSLRGLRMLLSLVGVLVLVIGAHVTTGHLCLVSPPQRGSMMGLNSAGQTHERAPLNHSEQEALAHVAKRRTYNDQAAIGT